MIQPRRVEFVAAGFVVHDRGQCGVGVRHAAEVHAVNAATQRERAAVAEIEPPRRQAAFLETEADFNGVWVKLILARPADERLDQLFHPLDRGARGEAAGLAGEEQAIAESSPLLFAELPDQHARFGW